MFPTSGWSNYQQNGLVNYKGIAEVLRVGKKVTQRRGSHDYAELLECQCRNEMASMKWRRRDSETVAGVEYRSSEIPRLPHLHVSSKDSFRAKRQDLWHHLKTLATSKRFWLACLISTFNARPDGDLFCLMFLHQRRDAQTLCTYV